MFNLGLAVARSHGAEPLRVMSVNIRLDVASDGANRWSLRSAALADEIRGYAPDIWGAQEVLPSQWQDLRQALPEYTSVGLGREANGGGEASPVFYRSERFEAVDSGTFWLSETPEVPGSRGWDAAFPRVVTWVVLRERSSGRELLAANTHFDHMGGQARAESAKLLAARLAALNQGRNLPVILTGDLNTGPDTAPVTELEQAGFTRADAAAEAHSGGTYTFHGFGMMPDSGRVWIDYVFYQGPFTCSLFRVANERVNGRWTTDHFPVLAALRWK